MKEKKYVMTDEKCDVIDVKNLPELDEKTRYSIRTELSTGLFLAIVYFLFIFSVPAINWFKPEWAFAKMYGGMSYSWFLTTIVAMVMAFVIAYVHTQLYESWEKNSLSLNREEKKSKKTITQENPKKSKEEMLL